MLLALLLSEQLVGLAGFFYFITLPYFTVAERIFGRQQRQLVAQSALDGELGVE
jgi:hypothetical protein